MARHAFENQRLIYRYIEPDACAVSGDHHVFVYPSGHEHYHFSHYGDFQFQTAGTSRGNKQAFCLQSTHRYSNNESSPLTHPFGSSESQGIQAGWGDDYGAGIECQWIDVTDTATRSGVTGTVAFQFTPTSSCAKARRPATHRVT